MLPVRSALERILRPAEGDLPSDFARKLLALDFSDSDHSRYCELAARAQAGEVTDQERLELDDLLTTNDVLTILHAKARASLKSDSSAA